jgi:hypothetical protein
MKKIITLLSFCVLLAACSSTPDPTVRPEWIDNAKVLYPSDNYLTAVGQASKRNRAAKNAMANLAEIFSVQVKTETNMLTQSIKDQSALGMTAESSTSLTRNISTETEQAIRGVEIKESWLSPAGEYYVLAVLEKHKAAANLRETINEFDAKSADLIDYSINNAPNSITAINALREARDAQITRKIADSQLRQVSAAGMHPDISIEKIEKLISKKLSALAITVKYKDEGHQRTLQAGVSSLGVMLTDDADIVISADIDITAPTLINGWYWLRGSYELSLLEKGKVISRKRWPIKISAKEAALLHARLEDKINQNVAQYVIELVSDEATP